MIYTMQYPDNRMNVDTDKIAMKFNAGGQQFVQSFNNEDREKFVEFLESEGFICIENRTNSRQNTIESRFPIVVELDSKTISCIGNVTTAACAASSKIIMSDRDFYLLYSAQMLEK